MKIIIENHQWEGVADLGHKQKTTKQMENPGPKSVAKKPSNFFK